MSPEIDPALASAQIETLAQQTQQQQQPVADAVGSGAGEVVGAAVEVATSDAGEGVLDAIGGIFSIFE